MLQTYQCGISHCVFKKNCLSGTVDPGAKIFGKVLLFSLSAVCVRPSNFHISFFVRQCKSYKMPVLAVFYFDFQYLSMAVSPHYSSSNC